MTKLVTGLEPITRVETLGNRVRDQLREAIMAGQFEPGQKLTLRAVAAALGVSVTPARDALYALGQEGVLDLRANGSVYVPDLSEANMVEISKIRIALEGLAAREAAHKLEDSEIDRIEEINEALVAADKVQDYNKLIPLNWQFHFSIYHGAGMPSLVRMIEGCWLKTGSYLNRLYPDFGDFSDGIRNHHRIVRELRARDAERLSLAIVTDINLSSEALVAQIAGKSRS